MKALVQRVKYTKLEVNGELVSEIPFGLVIYFGVKREDDINSAKNLALKISKLRVFEDENGKMNKSIKEVGGEVLCVSQFTLYADLNSGNRPSFINAEEPTKAKKIYEYFCEELSNCGLIVKRGIFGADMKISQLNDGPVSVVYEV